MSGAEVGTRLPSLVLPPISRATLALFAGASGDLNPVHIDLDAARAAGFDDVFAHGMLSMAYLGRAVTGWFPQQDLRGLATRFVAVTPVRASPTCRGTVERILVEGGERRAVIALSVVLADGTVTLRGEATVAIGAP